MKQNPKVGFEYLYICLRCDNAKVKRLEAVDIFFYVDQTRTVTKWTVGRGVNRETAVITRDVQSGQLSLGPSNFAGVL